MAKKAVWAMSTVSVALVGAAGSQFGLYGLNSIPSQLRALPWRGVLCMVGAVVSAAAAVHRVSRRYTPVASDEVVRGRRWDDPAAITAPITAAVTAAAAVGALAFTGLQTLVARRALVATEQGQITDRYSKAVDKLGSGTIDVRMGGIYALGRIMRDSPTDQPSVMDVLSAFVRVHHPRARIGRKPPVDVQAALSVLGRRDYAGDGDSRVDLTGTDLTNADLHEADLADAYLVGADLRGANLSQADLTDADLRNANFTDADLRNADFSGANLTKGDFTGANLARAKLEGSPTKPTVLTGARITCAQIPAGTTESSGGILDSPCDHTRQASRPGR